MRDCARRRVRTRESVRQQRWSAQQQSRKKKMMKKERRKLSKIDSVRIRRGKFLKNRRKSVDSINNNNICHRTKHATVPATHQNGAGAVAGTGVQEMEDKREMI